MSALRIVLEAIEIQFGFSAQRAAAEGYQSLGGALGDLALFFSELKQHHESLESDGFNGDQNELLRDLFNIATSIGVGQLAGTAFVSAAGTGALCLLPLAAGPGILMFTGVVLVGAGVNLVLNQLDGLGLSLIPAAIDLSQLTEGTTIIGSAFGDAIVSTQGNDTIRASLSDDVIANSGGSDVIFGGAGTDTLSYSARSEGINVFFSGAAATYLVTHNSGQDTIDGIEEVIGTSFNDNFVSGGTVDSPAFEGTLLGRGGDDTFLISNAGNSLFIDGGSGVDTLNLDSSFTGSTIIRMTSAPEGFVKYGSTGQDIRFESIEVISATAGDDSVQGNFESTDFDLWSGSDSIDASGGNDTIRIEFDEADAINGGGGFDTLIHTGTEGANINLGGMNIEAVLGSSGADTLTSSGGEVEILAGGSGNDTFNVSQSASSPTIIWGGAGSDQIRFDNLTIAPVGILAVTANNLTEENFHLFDV